MQVLVTDLEVPVLITIEETTYWENGVHPVWESSPCGFSVICLFLPSLCLISSLCPPESPRMEI